MLLLILLLFSVGVSGVVHTAQQARQEVKVKVVWFDFLLRFMLFFLFLCYCCLRWCTTTPAGVSLVPRKGGDGRACRALSGPAQHGLRHQRPREGRAARVFRPHTGRRCLLCLLYISYHRRSSRCIFFGQGTGAKNSHPMHVEEPAGKKEKKRDA